MSAILLVGIGVVLLVVFAIAIVFVVMSTIGRNDRD